MISRRTIEDFIKNPEDKRKKLNQIDPYRLQYRSILERLYGETWNKIDINFLQQEIEPFFPFFLQKPEKINKLSIRKIKINDSLKFNLESGINIITENEEKIFSCFAFGLLSQPFNIESKYFKEGDEVKLSLSIHQDRLRLTRKSHPASLDSVKINGQLFKNLSDAQLSIALKLNLYHFSKRRTLSGLNVFDNVMLVNLSRSPRNFKDQETMFLFGTPEIREILYICQILTITKEFYSEYVGKFQKRIQKLNQEIHDLRLISSEKSSEIEEIENQLNQLNLNGKTDDEINEIYLDKVKEISFYRNQLQLYEQANDKDAQQTDLLLDSLLIRERNLKGSLEENDHQIKKMRRKRDDLAERRQKLKLDGKNLVTSFSLLRNCRCGYIINDKNAEKNVKEGRCPICGNIPPNLEENKRESQRINQSIRELRKEDQKIELEMIQISKDSEIMQFQLNELQKNIKSENKGISQNNAGTIKYSITEATRKLLELTNIKGKIEGACSRRPRLNQLRSIIRDNKEQIEEKKRILQSNSKRLNTFQSISELIEKRQKEYLKLCKTSFNTPAMEVANNLWQNMNQLISAYNLKKLDINQGSQAKLNYFDIISNIYQPSDSTPLRLFYFISLLKISLKGSFSMPNLYVIKGISLSEIERFQEVFIKLEEEYKKYFQIIFITQDDHRDVNIPVQWYKTSENQSEPFIH